MDSRSQPAASSSTTTWAPPGLPVGPRTVTPCYSPWPAPRHRQASPRGALTSPKKHRPWRPLGLLQLDDDDDYTTRAVRFRSTPRFPCGRFPDTASCTTSMTKTKTGAGRTPPRRGWGCVPAQTRSHFPADCLEDDNDNNEDWRTTSPKQQDGTRTDSTPISRPEHCLPLGRDDDAHRAKTPRSGHHQPRLSGCAKDRGWLRSSWTTPTNGATER